VTAPLTSPAGAADTAEAAAEEYFDALHRADEPHAVGVACGLLDSGASGEDVLLRLVAPAQVRVGRLWQTGVWSVAQEHAASCIAERVVFAVGARTRSRGRRGHVVLSCLDGAWHALAARIVGEVLRMHDWKVTFLGAVPPIAYLVSFLHRDGPDVVAQACLADGHALLDHWTVP
jgi:methanogenic corrinoid protein MtbC1